MSSNNNKQHYAATVLEIKTQQTETLRHRQRHPSPNQTINYRVTYINKHWQSHYFCLWKFFLVCGEFWDNLLRSLRICPYFSCWMLAPLTMIRWFNLFSIDGVRSNTLWIFFYNLLIYTYVLFIEFYFILISIIVPTCEVNTKYCKKTTT